MSSDKNHSLIYFQYFIYKSLNEVPVVDWVRRSFGGMGYELVGIRVGTGGGPPRRGGVKSPPPPHPLILTLRNRKGDIKKSLIYKSINKRVVFYLRWPLPSVFIHWSLGQQSWQRMHYCYSFDPTISSLKRQHLSQSRQRLWT